MLSPFPREAYTDPSRFARELDLLFRAHGFAAASADDLGRPGAWVRVPMPDDRLVVARDAGLSLHLLRDVCRHRGVALLEGDQGTLSSLQISCPYHSWRYDLAGSLLRAPGAPDGLDHADHGLRAGHVAPLLTSLFAYPTLPSSAPSLPPWLASLELASLRRARRLSWEVDANWKLLVENFQESHHFPTVHPGLEALTPWRDSHSLVEADGWLGGVMSLRDEVETVSTTGLLRGRRPIVPASLRRLVHDAWIAPNLLTSLQPDYLLMYRLHPLAPGRTRVVGEVFVHRATPDDAGLDEVFAFWDRTNAEDRAVCERQQLGMASRWEGGVYATSEDGTRAFDRWVASRLDAEPSP
ncbi:MAG: Rieske 2Fe-2S domain-containing protein [Deltaproteobacteria bacterium]|jgi:Rieske 2Fe-2S family protein|nr:Rieske 2Fe-2S domain-containing protein [Deltaproteobacteria bacterium]MBK7069652.1 Rieske 2Fe-2S domain-containing protein [Deltaproteobacteria bacterium]MBK8692045.1 Rieske 2Fe-2S domain-containing protein [Deltaproteobacteria bacterium]MBP6831133.1 Rieske 2Fe-2S domain-containing protein [Deltaproteobacteria bacterium]